MQMRALPAYLKVPKEASNLVMRESHEEIVQAFETKNISPKGILFDPERVTIHRP